MSTLTSDLRYAVRSLLKNPGLTVAAILSLGLGIGANTTIFTWVQAVLLRPIPVATDPGTLRIAAMENREGQSRSWSYPNYQDFRDRATLIDVVAQDDQTLDPITFIAVPATLAAIALLATWIPVRRAGRVDPLVALRVD